MKSLYCSLAMVCSVFVTGANAQQDLFQELFPNPTTLAIHPDNPDNFLIGGGDGSVLRTTDGGDTWSLSGLRSSNGFSVSGIVFLSGDTVFASAQQSKDLVYRSLDGGQTWAALQLPYPNAHSKTLVQSTGVPGVVLLGSGLNNTHFITRDGGATVDTFQQSGTIHSVGNGQLISVAPSFSSTTTYLSDDLGVSWTLIGERAAHPFQVLLDGYDLNYYDADKWIIRANRQRKMLVTNDGGETIMQVEPGVGGVNAIKWRSATEVIAFGNNEAAISTDAGLTWTTITFINPAGITSSPTVYAFDSDGNEAAAYGREIYTRAVGATEWELKRFYLPFERIRSLIVGPGNTHFVNFNNVNRPQYSSAYRTDDDGVTWQPLSRTTADYIPLYIGSQGEIYAVRGSDTLYKSIDGGLTYTQVYLVPNDGSALYRVFSPGEGIVVAFYSTGCAVSSDDGLTWESHPAAGVYLAEGINEIAVLNPGTWGITVSSGQFFGLHVTQDTGRTFTRLTPPAQAADKHLSAGGGTLWMAPRWKSTDAGATWQAITATNFPGSFSSIDFRDAQKGIMSTSSSYYYTEDGGVTWEAGGQGLIGNIDASGWQNNGTKGFVAGFTLPLNRYDEGSWETIIVPASGGVSNTQDVAVNSIRLSPNPATAGNTIRVESGSKETYSANYMLIDALGRRVAVLESEAGLLKLPAFVPEGVYVLVDGNGKGAVRLLIN